MEWINDYFILFSLQVIVSVSSSINHSFNIILLRIHVDSSINSFTPIVKENLNLVYSITNKEEDWPKVIGRLPGQSSIYERIENDECSNSTVIGINKDNGDISLIDHPSYIHNNFIFCVLTRRSIEDPNGTILHFSIQKPFEIKETQFIPPYAPTIVIDHNTNENLHVLSQDGSNIKYYLKSVKFNEMSMRSSSSSSNSSSIDSDLSNLFIVDSSTAQIIINPQIVHEKNGYYTLTITANNNNTKIGQFDREVHVVPFQSQLRLVFDMKSDELGRNMESFERKLNKVLEGRGKVYLTTPSMKMHSNKSSLCLHIIKENILLDESSVKSLLSLPIGESPLAKLYHAYKVIDLGECHSSSISVSSFLSSSFSSSFIISLFVISLLSFILITSILYVCCVIRVKDSLIKKQIEVKRQMDISHRESPSQFLTLQVPPPMAPYQLY